MSFDNIWQWSETAASNTAIASTDITGATGKVKDGDNAIRAMMSQIITMEGKGTDVASATTVTLGTERYYHITGTTAINDIDFTDAVDGRWAWLIFDDALTLDHAGSILLPGNEDIVTAAGDRALFVQDSGNNVICLSYVRAAAPPLNDIIEDGTYTPTFAGVTNIAAISAAGTWWYTRIGNVVMGGGAADVDATTTSTDTQFTMTLPVASNFTSGTNAAGTGGGANDESWRIQANSTSDILTVSGVVKTAASHTVYLHYTYRVM